MQPTTTVSNAPAGVACGGNKFRITSLPRSKTLGSCWFARCHSLRPRVPSLSNRHFLHAFSQIASFVGRLAPAQGCLTFIHRLEVPPQPPSKCCIHTQPHLGNSPSLLPPKFAKRKI